MATKTAAKAGGKKKGKKGGAGSGLTKVGLVLIAVVMIPFSLPTVLLLFCTMLPTLVAALCDRGTNRFAWLCVGGLNFSGVAYYLFDLWFGSHTMDHAIEILTDVLALIIIYGAAALGWLLYLAMPPVIAAFLSIAAQRRIAQLKANQRKLIDQWGESVAQPLGE